MKREFVVHEIYINKEADRKKAALELWRRANAVVRARRKAYHAMCHLLQTEQGGRGKTTGERKHSKSKSVAAALCRTAEMGRRGSLY